MTKVAPCLLLLVIGIVLIRLSPCLGHGSCRHTPEALEVLERLQSNIHSEIPFAQNSRYDSQLFSPVRSTCPEYPPLSDEIHLQSLCPWEYYENHNENRYPHNIIYANCTCASCLGNSYRCRPVYHTIPVIRQTCQDGEYDFFWDNERIPVGCTCSHPGTRRKKWFFT